MEVTRVESLRVGVVGAGWVAQDRYLPVLAKSDNARLVGVADPNKARGSEVAEQYGVGSFSGHLDLLDAGLDLLFVCTSPWSHAEIAMDAAKFGVDVMTEKPMAVGRESAAAMVDTAGENGTLLAVSHNFLFSRSMRKALRMTSEGRIGRVRHVQAFQASSPARRLPVWYPELPGGLFYDESPHMMYLLEAFLGNLTLRSAWASPGSDGDHTHERLEAQFQGGDDVTATLTMVFSAPVSEWFLTIIGTEGILTVDVFRDICIRIPPDGSHSARDILGTSIHALSGHLLGTVNTGTRIFGKRQFWGHDMLIGGVLRAAQDSSAAPITGADGARVVNNIEDVLDAVGR
jgi:scyllo-inositol 2-dehydrogenase (NADP+)